MVKSRSELWFPTELLCVILSKLPSKSLIRFRSVSKTWRRTIENPEFIKSYKKRSESQIFVFQLEHGKVELAVRCSNTFRVVKAADHDFPTEFGEAYRLVGCVGCVDGLFLLQCRLVSQDHLLFQSFRRVWWNPSIRRLSFLPQVPIEAKGGQTWSVGIGYDPWIKDYKHVRISRNQAWMNEIDSVMVYTMGTNSWSTIPFKHRGDKPWYKVNKFEFENVCFRGILYLIARTLDPSDMKTMKQHLVSFDLRTEEFSCANLPIQDKVEEFDREWHLKCASDGSRFALVSIRKCDGCIWFAHGEGGGVTWGKRYAFYLSIPQGCLGGLGYVLNIDLNEASSVDMLLRVGDYVTLYNVTESHQEQTLLCSGKSKPYYFSHAFLSSSFVESLALLNQIHPWTK